MTTTPSPQPVQTGAYEFTATAANTYTPNYTIQYDSEIEVFHFGSFTPIDSAKYSIGNIAVGSFDITFSAGVLTVGQKYLVKRVYLLEGDVDFSTGVTAQSVQDGFNNSTRQVQNTDENLKFVPSYNLTDTLTAADTQLPQLATPASGKHTTWVKDSSGAIISYEISSLDPSAHALEVALAANTDPASSGGTKVGVNVDGHATNAQAELTALDAAVTTLVTKVDGIAGSDTVSSDIYLDTLEQNSGGATEGPTTQAEAFVLRLEKALGFIGDASFVLGHVIFLQNNDDPASESGFIRMINTTENDGFTIGKTGSGDYVGAKYEKLYKKMWTSNVLVGTTWNGGDGWPLSPATTSAGSADADWDAGHTLTMPFWNSTRGAVFSPLLGREIGSALYEVSAAYQSAGAIPATAPSLYGYLGMVPFIQIYGGWGDYLTHNGLGS